MRRPGDSGPAAVIGSGFTLLVLLLALGLPVAVVLALTGYVLSETYAFFPMTGAAGELAWNSSNDFILIAAPMFIMMGELMHRSGVSGNVSSRRWPPGSRNVPGRLMHTNIAASAVFAATSGSSIATAATIGTVAIPTMDAGGYNRPLFLGSIAAGGTLGILIPPSINMILYAVLTDTSVADLYAAGLRPRLPARRALLGHRAGARPLAPGLGRAGRGGAGFALAGAPRRARAPAAAARGSSPSSWARSTPGIATPTEAAALGLMATVALVAVNGASSRLAVLLRAFEGTVRTTCMIMLIVIAAFFANFVMVSIGLVGAITDAVLSLGWPPLGMLAVIVAFYLLLGCFMETLSMMIATTPVVVPGGRLAGLLAGLVGRGLRHPDRGRAHHAARWA